MRTIRVAALTAAAVGLGVFAVGCGPQPTTGQSNTGGTTKTTGKGDTNTNTTTKTPEVGDLAGKKKAAADDFNKQLAPQKDALEKLKAKVAEDDKNSGGDATKMTAVNVLRGKKEEAEKVVGEIEKKIGELAGVKDDKGLEDAKKAITEQIEKVKPLLKDYLPAK
jgi:hypothetical protein